MPLDPYESIFEQFPPASPEDWKNKIISDLKGKPFEELTTHSSEGIDILPFYTKEDNKKYKLSIPEKHSTGWVIAERIKVQDIQAANRQALEALQMGANTIIFDLQQKVSSKEDVELLVKDILLDIAPVRFENYTEENKELLQSAVKGSCPPVIRISRQNTITDELVFALQSGIKEEIRSVNFNFHFYIGENYFFEIAKLRAFRWQWKQVCELNNYSYETFIISETTTRQSTGIDEYDNMLRNTTEAMSAVLGGCDALIINPHDKEETSFGRRIARNINHILQHESYFNDIQDAAKGSYYIEYLTYQFAKTAWEKFRSEP